MSSCSTPQNGRYASCDLARSGQAWRAGANKIAAHRERGAEPGVGDCASHRPAVVRREASESSSAVRHQGTGCYRAAPTDRPRGDWLAADPTSLTTRRAIQILGASDQDRRVDPDQLPARAARALLAGQDVCHRSVPGPRSCPPAVCCRVNHQSESAKPSPQVSAPVCPQCVELQLMRYGSMSDDP